MNKRINLSPMELRSDTYNGFVSSKKTIMVKRLQMNQQKDL